MYAITLNAFLFINQSLTAVVGIPIRVGAEHLPNTLPAVLENAENGLSGRARTILCALPEEWVELETKISAMTEEIGRISRSNEGCKRLMGVPGIGPIISSALVQRSATRAHSAKEETWLRGSDWLLVNIPRAASRSCWGSASAETSTCGSSWWKVREGRSHDSIEASFGPWMDPLRDRKHSNVAVVAVANKLARIAWAVLQQASSIVPSRKGGGKDANRWRDSHISHHTTTALYKFFPGIARRITDERTGQTGPLITSP